MLRFGAFELDPVAGDLRKSGLRLRLPRQPFKVLAYLAERQGQVVSREELRTALWGTKTFVDFDAGLNTAVSKIRQVLGDSADAPRFVETVPNRGYRFVAPVERPSPPPAQPNPEPRWWRLAAIALLALCLLGWAGWRIAGVPSTRELRLTQLTRDAGLSMQPALSPDGNLLAYASDRGADGNLDIWVMHIAGGEAVRLTRDSAVDDDPSFSPDGGEILFHSNRGEGGIFVVPTMGGPERLIVPKGLYPRWSPDGKYVAYSTGVESAAGRLRTVSLAEGTLRELDTGGVFAVQPIWSQDSQSLYFWGSSQIGWQERAIDLWRVPAAGGRAVAVGVRRALERKGVSIRVLSVPLVKPAWMGDRSLVVAGQLGDGTSLWLVPLSADGNAVEGEPVRLTQGTMETQPVVSRNGRIAFSTFRLTSDIWFLPLNPATGAVAGTARPLTRGDAENTFPTLNVDGRTLVYASTRGGNFDVWKRDLPGEADRPLAITPSPEYRGMISPDGKRVAFNRVGAKGRCVFEMPASGGPERMLCQDYNGLGWSGDSRRVLYWQGSPARQYTVDVVSGQQQLVVEAGRKSVYGGAFSPDDRWVSVAIAEEDVQQCSLFIAPVRDGRAANLDEWVEIERTRYCPRGLWSADQSMFYFNSWRDGDACLWALRLDRRTGRPAGDAFPVHHFHSARHVFGLGEAGFAVAPNGLYFSLRERRGNIWLADTGSPDGASVPAPVSRTSVSR